MSAGGVDGVGCRCDARCDRRQLGWGVVGLAIGPEWAGSQVGLGGCKVPI